jgi:adenine-specific DNA-methyltransferase
MMLFTKAITGHTRKTRYLVAELTWKNKSIHPAVDLSGRNSYRFITTETINHLPQTVQSAATLFPDYAWHNRLIHGNASLVLPALLPDFVGMIDLVYIDPPFMTGRDFKSGSQLAYSDKWGNSLDVYLSWLYEIFSLLHALLARDGSLYVHLDWRAAHYARVLLDEVFGLSLDAGGAGFKNEIIWHYQSGGRTSRHYARKHDTILLYTKSGDYCFHPERIGERRGAQKRNHMRREVDEAGHVQWTIKSAGRIYSYSEDSLMTPPDVWCDINHLHQKDPERSGYATQKPAALLERVLLASSEEHDLILDCFCGSGVTPCVAQQLGRRWLACDQSELAIATTRERLMKQEQSYPFALQRLEQTHMEKEAVKSTKED